MESLTNEHLHDLDKKYYLQTFKRYPLALERGEGALVWDVEGNEYLDGLAGIAVNNLGHCHPDVQNAIKKQVGKLIHISNFYVSKPQVELSEYLCKLSGLDRVFLTNSGAESVEGAIKLARKYAHLNHRGGTVIAMENSFHGRTLATIAMGKSSMQKGFEPIPQGFAQVPFNNMEAIEDIVENDTAAIIVEPVQGEGGINLAEKDFLQELRKFCDDKNIVLIFDEIQCGMGRTGKLFAKDHFGVQPDIMTLAKGLGGGFPVGAILCNEKVGSAIDFGDHGTTFGGNPLACAAALATLGVINQPEFLDEVIDKGNHLKEKIRSLADPDIKEIRGMGLMIGIEFMFETKPLVSKMLEHGVLVNSTADTVLRIVPPLIISKREINKIVKVMALSHEEIKENV